MLEHVMAVRFDGRAGHGRTKPCFVACVNSGSEEVEVVAKLSAGCDRGVKALAIEAVCAMLAADLELPIPEPFLVKLIPDFIDQVEDDEIRELARNSSSIAFGSRRLPPGYVTWLNGRPLPAGAVQIGQEIFAFDALIDNADRRPNNPNCLSNGERIAIYDHELAFPGQMLFVRPPLPWQVGGLQFYAEPDHHIFHASLKGKPVNLDRFRIAWAQVSDERLGEYLSALPAAWSVADDEARRIARVIADVRDNIDATMLEVARALG